MSLKFCLVAICLLAVAHADWDEIFFSAARYTNMTADGDDNAVGFAFDLEAFEELATKLFPESPVDAFEVASCAGLCQNTANSCSSGYKTGLCPGPSNIKCCPMSTPSCSGQCQDTSLSCSNGYQTGKCPGPSNMKCCPSSGGGGGGVPSGTSAQRKGIYDAAMALYNHRSSEHYTQGSKRWIGITDKVRPPNAPSYSDCSSAASWCYWTVFGNGPDFLNGQSWKGGYTGTMSGRGRSVSCSSMQVGDLAFYGHPISHVSISIGNGKVVSHGSDPVGLYSYNYRSDLNQCRTYF